MTATHPRGDSPPTARRPAPRLERARASRQAVRAPHELRVVLLVERDRHLDRIPEIATLEPGAVRIDGGLRAPVLSQQPPHVTEPVARSKHPERPLAEHEIFTRYLDHRIRGVCKHRPRARLVE